MNIRNALFMMTMAVMIIACKSNQVDSPAEVNGKKLILSHGGGFAGTYSIYHLLENGQLFKATKTKGVTNKEKSLPKDIAKQIFSNYEVLDLANAEAKNYGNLVYSIEMHEGDAVTKTSWEKGDKGSETLQLFFRSVMNQIKKNNDTDYNPKKSEINAKF